MCSFKITLLIGRVSLVLSMPFVYNLGFGSYKHMFAANNPSSKGILVRAGVHSVSEYQEKCVAFTAQQQLFALCFLDLEDFLLISICRQINGNIIYFPWKKKTWFISVWQAYTDHFVNLGQFEKKILEASRETPKRMQSCFKAGTERPSTQPGGTGLSCFSLAMRRPGLGPSETRTSWTGSKWEMSPAPLPPAPCTQSYSSTVLPSTCTCPREHPPSWQKEETKERKTSGKCS